jgi:hypothetical protein
MLSRRSKQQSIHLVNAYILRHGVAEGVGIDLLMKCNVLIVCSRLISRPRWLGSKHLFGLFGILTTSSWIILGLLLPNLLSAKNIYIAQTALGSGSGVDAADAKAYTFFNTSGNWGSGSTKISAGDTVWVEGNIANQLSFQGSGTAGNPITLKFDIGASMITGVFPSSGAIYLPGSSSYLVLDGSGTAIIENTNNGDASLGYGNQVSCTLISGNSSPYNLNNIEVKGFTILNAYVPNPGNASSGAGGGGISFSTGGTNINIHDCYITNGGFTGINITCGTSSGLCDNLRIHNCTAWGCNWDISINEGSSGVYAGSIYIYNNICGGNWTWDTGTADNFHHNGIMVFCGPAGTEQFTNIYIYNNKIGPDLSKAGNDTAWIFIDWNGTGTCFQNCWIYNNCLYATNGFGPDGGFITGGAVHMYCLNNSIYGAGTGGGGMGGANTGQTTYYSNNIVEGVGSPIGDNSGSTSYSDYNIFYNNSGTFKSSGGTPMSYAAWQSSGKDAHSIAKNPELNNPSSGDLTLQSNSPAIGAGVNMSSYFTNDIAGNSRPSSGAWDIGAYEYALGSSFPPTVSAITQIGAVVNTNTTGFLANEGTTVQLSASASAPNSDSISWQWLYSVNGGTPIVYQSGSGTSPSSSFTYPVGTGGSTYVWSLLVTDSQTQLSAKSQLTFNVELTAPLNPHIIQ